MFAIHNCVLGISPGTPFSGVKSTLSTGRATSPSTCLWHEKLVDSSAARIITEGTRKRNTRRKVPGQVRHSSLESTTSACSVAWIFG